MNREMAAMFPSGIKALIVDHDSRFIKSSSMLLSLLNFNVASCGSPTSALKVLSGDKIKDMDVVLINAEKAATCGFDFRGIVETDLGIPVIYFLSRDHVATGGEADELLRTLWDSTYVLRTPLEANDVCDLWMVIGWRKCYLEKKAKGADGRRAVQPFMAGGSTTMDEEEREDEDRVHFKVVGTGGRGRKRKSDSNTVAGSSGTTVVAGDQTVKRKGKMKVTGEHERDDVSSQQQPATEKAALLPLVRHQQQQPAAAATTIEAIANATRPRWNQAAAGNVVFGNGASPTGVANMATTVTYKPEISRGCNQQQQNVCPPLMFGPFPYQGPRPPMFLPLQPYSSRTESISGATAVGVSAAGAGQSGNAATSLLQPLNLAIEPDGRDEVAAMVAMYTESNPPVAQAAPAALHNNSSAHMAPQQQHIGHGVAPTQAAAAARQEVLNNGDNTYSTSLMAPTANQVLDMASNVNELTMAGGEIFSNSNDASLTAPQDLAAAPDGDQLAPGALDAMSASLMGSPGHGAAMDGNSGLEFDAMFSPDQYDYDNTMFPLEALLGLDDAPVYEDGVDYQQGCAAAGTADDAPETSLIGGSDDNLNILDDYLFMDSTGDFNNGRE